MSQLGSRESGTREDRRTGQKVPVYGTVDKGWAWIVLVAMTFWNALVAGTLKSFGVIYLEFLDRYNRGPVATSWLGFSFSFLTTLIAPISGYIGDHVSLKSQRIIVMCLSIVTTVSIAVTGSMPTLEGAIFTYGLAGITVSLVDTPILSLIGKYFVKRRFLAAGVVASGSSLGTLVLPLLLTFLVREYSISGAMVVFGAVWLNTILVGAVVRPLRSRALSAAENDVDDTGVRLDENTDKALQTSSSEDADKIDENSLYDKKIHTSTLSLDILPNGLNACKHSNVIKYSASVPASLELNVKSNTERHYHSLHEVSGKLHAERKCSTSVEDTNRHQQMSNQKSSSELAVCEETCPMKPLPPGKKIIQMISGYWKFLTSPGLPVLVFSLTIGSFAYFSQLFLLPPFGQEVGMSRINGASLVSIANAVELVSRVTVGTLVDRKLVRKSVVVKTNFSVAGIASLVFSFVPHSTALYVYVVVFGLFGGMFISLSLPLMMDMVKDTQMASATGVFLFVTGIGISLGPPILGSVRELTGSYVNCFRVCGACYAISLLLYLVHNGDIPLCCRRGEKATGVEENRLESK